MAYTKTTWVDETLASAELYNISAAGSSGSAIHSNVKIELSTPVSVAGTSVDATKMNNIESGLDNLFKYGQDYASIANTTSLNGSVALTNTSVILQFFNANGSNRNINFPTPGSTNHLFGISNSGSAGNLILNDSSSTIIEPGITRFFWPGVSAYQVNGYSLPIGTTAGQKMVYAPAEATKKAFILDTFTWNIIIGNGAATVTTGVKGWLEVPYACTLTSIRLFADEAGAIVVDIWKDTYANFPPTDADSITSATPPTIPATNQKAEDTSLTNWTKTFAKGDILGFNVDSATTIKQATLSLSGYKTAVA